MIDERLIDPFAEEQTPDPFAEFNPFADEETPAPAPEPSFPEPEVFAGPSMPEPQVPDATPEDAVAIEQHAAAPPVPTPEPLGLPQTREVPEIQQAGAWDHSPLPTMGADESLQATLPYQSDEDVAGSMMAKRRNAASVADVERARVNAQRNREEAAFAGEQKLYAEKLQQLDEERAAAAREPIDPEKYYSDRGAGGTIRDVIGAVIGGYLAFGSKGNGVNTYVQHMKQRIKDNIAAQIQNKRDTLADLDSQRGSTLQQMQMNAADRRRAFILEDRALQEIEVELAREQNKYAEGGTSHEAVEMMKRGIGRARAANIAANDAAMRKEAREETEVGLKVADQKRKWMELDMQRREAARRAAAARRSRLPQGTQPGARVINPDALKKGHTITGLKDAAGNPIVFAFETSGERAEANQKILAVRKARRFRTKLKELGGIQREILKGRLAPAAAQLKAQELQNLTLDMARLLGGTVTAGDVAETQKAIIKDPNAILQNVEATEALVDNYVEIAEDGLGMYLSTRTPSGTEVLGVEELSTAKETPDQADRDFEEIMHGLQGNTFDKRTGGRRKATRDEIVQLGASLAQNVTHSRTGGEAREAMRRLELLEKEARKAGNDEAANTLRGYMKATEQLRVPQNPSQLGDGAIREGILGGNLADLQGDAQFHSDYNPNTEDTPPWLDEVEQREFQKRQGPAFDTGRYK